MYDLSTQVTGTAQNIYAATVELATFVASADCIVSPAVRLSSLTGTAANLTIGYRHTTSGGTAIGEWVEQFAKPQAASTVATSQLPLVRLDTGEKLVVTARSSNSSDTAAAFAIDWPGELLADTVATQLAAIKAKTDLLTAGTSVTVVSPVSADGTSVDIVRGDSYLTADSNPLTMTITSDRLPSTLPLSTTVSLVLDRRSDPAATVSLTGTVTADGATKTVTFDAANTVTGALALGTYAYLGSVRFLLGGTATKVVTAARLRVNVLDEARSSDA
jgi:hypothetical protein